MVLRNLRYLLRRSGRLCADADKPTIVEDHPDADLLDITDVGCYNRVACRRAACVIDAPAGDRRRMYLLSAAWIAASWGQLRVECCRYVGHCNCATDIKEVTFLGSNDELVACSSDDGCVFIYDAVRAL